MLVLPPCLHQMESVEDVVIVGAGLAGLATALGLHRKGIKSLVLESADSSRVTGFSLLTWTNAWRALDVLGVGDSVRPHQVRLQQSASVSSLSGALTSRTSLTSRSKFGEHEARFVSRNLLVKTMEEELPEGTIKYSSKLVSIEEQGHLKLLHLADGSVLKTKVLVGCDGVNSVVAGWLGLKKPSFCGRTASRGFTEYPEGHGFKPELFRYFGHGFRCGFVPCDEKSIYWFFDWTPTKEENEAGESATCTKQLVLCKLRKSKVPEERIQVIEKSETSTIASSLLRFRSPLDLIWGYICKGNVCVAGDAFHPMTPDLGQGGCMALEDGVVLARCLGEAILKGGGEYVDIEEGLKKFAKERRWRSFGTVATSYVWGAIQQSDGVITSYLRDNFLSATLANMYLKKADFDCGEL